MKKIDFNFKKPSQQQLNSLLELYQTGKYPDAEKLSLSITQEFPKHQRRVVIWNQITRFNYFVIIFFKII